MNNIIGIGIFALILAGAVGVFDLLNQQRSQQATLDAHISAALIRNNLTSHIQNGTALTFTVNSSENGTIFDCIKNSTPCPLGPTNLSVVRDAANQIVLDTRGTNGMGLNGQICTGYSSSGNSDCPFQLSVTWEPVCAGACAPPVTMRFAVNFIYSPSAHKRAPFSPMSHNFVLDRPQP